MFLLRSPYDEYLNIIFYFTGMSEKMQYVKSNIFSYSGKIIMSFFGLIYTLLIANYVGPVEYGLVNYYISFTLGLIGTFGLFYFGGLIGLFMPKWKSRTFMKYNFIAISIISFLIFMGLYIFSEDVVRHLNKVNFELLKITAFLLLVVPFTLFYIWVFRSYKLFGKELKFNLIVVTLNLFSAFLLVIVFQYGVVGVVYALLFSNICGLAYLFFHSRYLRYLDKPIDFSAIKKYSLFCVPATLLGRIDDQLLMVFMGLFVVDNDLGLYYIALKIVSTVLGTPVSALAEVILPYTSESSSDKKKISRYFSLCIKFSLIVNFVLSILLIVFSKYVLILLFPKYVEAYTFIIMLIPLTVVSSLNPLNSLYASLNRMDVIARSKFVLLISTLVFGLLFMPMYGVLGLILVSILNTIFTTAVLVYYLKHVNLEIELIPRKQDLMYFWASLKKVIDVKFRHKKI